MIEPLPLPPSVPTTWANFLANNKAKITGAVTAFFAWVAFSSSPIAIHHIAWPNWIVSISDFAALGGFITFIGVVKDFNVTGGTKPQPGIQFAAVVPVDAVQESSVDRKV